MANYKISIGRYNDDGIDALHPRIRDYYFSILTRYPDGISHEELMRGTFVDRAKGQCFMEHLVKAKLIQEDKVDEDNIIYKPVDQTYDGQSR